MQHPLMITRHSAMTHSTLNLRFSSPPRGTLQQFLSLPFTGPIEPSLCLSSAVRYAPSFPPLRFCLIYVPSNKRHTSSPSLFYLCLIPSFFVVCYRETTETGTINRRPGRLLPLFQRAIKDIHHHQAIDNQAPLSSFIPGENHAPAHTSFLVQSTCPIVPDTSDKLLFFSSPC